MLRQIVIHENRHKNQVAQCDTHQELVEMAKLLQGDRVIITMHNGASMAGNLWQVDGPYFRTVDTQNHNRVRKFDMRMAEVIHCQLEV